MDKWLQPSPGTGRKTRLRASRYASVFILLFSILYSSACTRIVIYPSEETATAQAQGKTQTAALLPTATFEEFFSESTAVPRPSQTGVPQGGGDPILPDKTPTMSNLQPAATSTSAERTTDTAPILYYTQSSDTLESICARFDVLPEEITSPDLKEIPSNAFLKPDLLLLIPDRLEETTQTERLMPDSEIIFSASAIGFDSDAFVKEAGGYLAEYQEWRTDGWYNGGQVIERVAYENSVNPRLLLAIVQYQSDWLYGFPTNLAEVDYPIGWKEFEYRELYKQLTWAIQQVSIGYYGWRAGRINELTFPDGSTLRLAPELNAGTVAIMYLFSRLYNPREWGAVLYGPESFINLYTTLFGDPWLRAQTVEPLYPTDLKQPDLILPFQPGKTWSLTSGPHAVWGPDGVMGAIDFAPPSIENSCMASEEWATAAASGIVTRSYNGIVVIDLDGDGFEQTGWSLFYLHIYHEGRVPAGTWVNVGDPIGHPSCEGGRATGTHIHIARKYNGEWIPADGPLPFTLDGWVVHEGDAPYLGTMTKGDRVVISDVNSTYISKIAREPDL